MGTVSEHQQAETMIHNMRVAGAIDQDCYAKCIISLASEYINCHLDVEKALVLINKIPASYYGAVFIKQMQEDGPFAEAMVELVYRLNQLGTMGNAHQINMATARA